MEPWQEGVLSVLLSSHQDHWFFRNGSTGINSGPAGCHSTDLIEPGIRFQPSWMSVDYGEEGAVDWPQPAGIELYATCADCGNEQTYKLDIDDPIDLAKLLALLAEKPGFSFFKRVHE